MHVTKNVTIIIEISFAQWVLDIGNGNVSHGYLVDNVALIVSMLLPKNNLHALIDCIYGDLQMIQNYAANSLCWVQFLFSSPDM